MRPGRLGESQRSLCLSAGCHGVDFYFGPANPPNSGPSFPIMAGVSGHSTSQVLEYIVDAHFAGADYILVLPPGYFGAALSPPAMLRDFYRHVSIGAWEFGLPTVIYNFRTSLPLPPPYSMLPLLTPC